MGYPIRVLTGFLALGFGYGVTVTCTLWDCKWQFQTVSQPTDLRPLGFSKEKKERKKEDWERLWSDFAWQKQSLIYSTPSPLSPFHLCRSRDLHAFIWSYVLIWWGGEGYFKTLRLMRGDGESDWNEMAEVRWRRLLCLLMWWWFVSSRLYIRWVMAICGWFLTVGCIHLPGGSNHHHVFHLKEFLMFYCHPIFLNLQTVSQTRL